MAEELKVNDYVVSEVKEIIATTRVLRVSLLWLRSSGFKGKVQVIDGYFDDGSKTDKVLFEIDV